MVRPSSLCRCVWTISVSQESKQLTGCRTAANMYIYVWWRIGSTPSNNNQHIIAVLMDLSKAFDCLPHQLIVAKLKAYGRDSKGCAQIWSYLSARRQRIRLSGTASEWLELIKGVPQGSMRRPIRYNVLMNDIYMALT